MLVLLKFHQEDRHDVHAVEREFATTDLASIEAALQVATDALLEARLNRRDRLKFSECTRAAALTLGQIASSEAEVDALMALLDGCTRVTVAA